MWHKMTQVVFYFCGFQQWTADPTPNTPPVKYQWWSGISPTFIFQQWTEPKAVILFVEQTISIIAKNGYSLFVVQIVILFLRTDEQIAKIGLFLFVYSFWAITNRQTEGAVHPPPKWIDKWTSSVSHLFCTTPLILFLRQICRSYTIPFFTKLAFVKKSSMLQFWCWREEDYWSIGLFAIRCSPDFTTKSWFLFNSKKILLIARMAVRYPLFDEQNHSLNMGAHCPVPLKVHVSLTLIPHISFPSSNVYTAFVPLTLLDVLVTNMICSLTVE